MGKSDKKKKTSSYWKKLVFASIPALFVLDSVKSGKALITWGFIMSYDEVGALFLLERIVSENIQANFTKASLGISCQQTPP